jgi:hypothetical protein
MHVSNRFTRPSAGEVGKGPAPRMYQRLGRTLAATALFFLASFGHGKTASAEIKIANLDGWEITTSGRVNGFFSFVRGNAYPTTIIRGVSATDNKLSAGAGLESQQYDADRTFQTLRFRSGFVGAVLGFGVKTALTRTTSMSAHIETWNTIETSRNKASPNPSDVRQAYGKIEGPWGGLLFGRALALFSRGAITLDFLYQHGFGLGYPCNADSGGPTCGAVGYGVVFAGFNPQLTYNTPDLGGFQLSVGLFDPSNSPGKLESTPLPRLESEMTFEKTFTDGKVHFFVNGMIQPLKENWLNAHDRLKAAGASDDEANATTDLKTVTTRAVNYGFWAELWKLRLGFSSHYGYGIGMNNALENTPVVFDSAHDPRKFDAYYGVVGLDLDPVYLNGGYGITRLFTTEQDRQDALTAQQDPIRSQRGISAGINFRFSKNLVAALEYFNAHHTWYLGEEQRVEIVNSGLTMVW